MLLACVCYHFASIKYEKGELIFSSSDRDIDLIQPSFFTYDSERCSLVYLH